MGGKLELSGNCFERRPVKCPWCGREGRADQMRWHSRVHRQVKEQRRDLEDDLDRLVLAEYESK